ncbi:MAG: hypothetical protein HYS17_08770 [Micavibrio aeruginosavorus]|uniref:Lipoprotein n=1 Tax=Micavibrio aeruginosavorus TaxID=349221 RepID=A0A7T5UJ85_9BACT|nr:MAG: hypothetical protein HYS17_08770 [Micavibrio aeruginosavorus]
MPAQRSAHRLSLYIVLAGLMSMGLCGCGVKPDSLSPPPGAEETVFPRTYPDPSTDPQS